MDADELLELIEAYADARTKVGVYGVASTSEDRAAKEDAYDALNHYIDYHLN